MLIISEHDSWIESLPLTYVGLARMLPPKMFMHALLAVGSAEDWLKIKWFMPSFKAQIPLN